MRFNVIFMVFLFALPMSVKAEVVTDPLKYYLTRFGAAMLLNNTKKLMRYEKDFNNDGIPEIFITTEKRVNHREGNVWSVYISENGHYVESPGGTDVPTFFPDGVYIGYLPEYGQIGILNYFPGSARDGSLLAYTLQGIKFVKHNLGTIYPSGGDKALFKKYFGDDAKGIDVINEDLESAMKSLGLSTEVKMPKKLDCGKEEMEFYPCKGQVRH